MEPPLHTVVVGAVFGEILAIGNAFFVTNFCVAAAEHVVAVIVSVTSTVPAPAAPHATVIELVPVPAVIDPPTTVHEYV